MYILHGPYHKQVVKISHFLRKVLDVFVVAYIQTGQGAELSYFLGDLNKIVHTYMTNSADHFISQDVQFSAPSLSH